MWLRSVEAPRPEPPASAAASEAEVEALTSRAAAATAAATASPAAFPSSPTSCSSLCEGSIPESAVAVESALLRTEVGGPLTPSASLSARGETAMCLCGCSARSAASGLKPSSARTRVSLRRLPSKDERRLLECTDACASCGGAWEESVSTQADGDKRDRRRVDGPFTT